VGISALPNVVISFFFRAGVIDVILNLYDTANRNIDNPKWQEVLKNCLSLLSSLGSKDAYPKGGKVCSLCLRDLKSNPKVSQCAMCLDLVCETCAKVVKVHNDHNIVFEDVEQSFAVDIFLKNGLLRRMISTLERHQDLPVTSMSKQYTFAPLEVPIFGIGDLWLLVLFF
jgi:hypothetical protein